ncbi:Stk1 family PASTA domain-containing Ser/Thr kinase [Megasphaera lornae]|uniref:non-specific serine/threonine protein kinase n=1 Tax=Megasphaera lornae TaxID=1000568 RepID=D3LUT5_9FIRM|nr:Stk1 family PASTA domain-containing Ser/Thr kinase [Megasphaera genomosp. type_1]EFD94084.1 kinase domain protein [Megasphaera genomosp. type_1 str. 28L]
MMKVVEQETMTGHTLANRYQILEEVGTGGMAVVYKARDILLDRIVAVKILHAEYGNDHEFVTRFRQEAQAAAKLSHPNIVNIYDVGKDGDIHYIVMEFVRGETLKEYIEKHGHLPINTSIQIAFDIGEALESAHHNGLVHCDIKPHNILVTETGRIKVADFGIARAINSSATMKEDKKILGSVHYFSPEQASGNTLDERTDIYSLGVVMYEMMTGVVPFEGDTPLSIALQHVQDAIPLPTKYNRRIPRLVERCILKAMAKNPDDRFQSVEELMSELRLSQGFVNSNKGAMPIIKKGFEGTVKLPPVPEKNTRGEGNIFNRFLDSVSRHSKKSIIIAMGSVFIIAFLWAFFSFGNFWSTQDITVPDVTGKQMEIAQTMLTDKHLSVSIKEVDSSDVPVGEVITQTPIGGSVVKANRTIYLTVSRGNHGDTVLVPDLRGLTLDEATRKLKEIGLSVGTVTYADADRDDGKILQQTPSSPDKVAQNTTIDVVVSRVKVKEAAPVNVPDTRGMSLDTAMQTLNNAGISIGTVGNLNSNLPNAQATVTGQSLRKGGRTADLYVTYPQTADTSSADVSKEGTGAMRSGKVNIHVPNGSSNPHVQIVLTDDNGSRTVYDKVQAGGDTVVKNVSGVGRTHVKVFINNTLVQDQYL